MYDALLIGGGPASLSAAINLRARNKTVLLIGNREYSIKLEKAPQIDNYLGLPAISGLDMAKTFLAHAKESGAEMTNERVNQIFPLSRSFQVMTDQNKIYEGRSLILATGTAISKTIPGEDDLLGRGVSYCATCDGMLYRGKTVAVLGFTKTAEKDAEFLAGICNKVYYLPYYKEVGGLNPKIQLLEGKVERINGQDMVDSIVISDKEIPCSAAFIIRDSVPLENLLPGLEQDGKHILVDRLMQTNIPGVFAAGDCVGKPYQIAKAVGEGLVAALSASSYLEAQDD